ncbi:Glycosyl transferase, family 39 [Trichormus variabilis ATCC 29413]|uniref:Glycosyl transferase, family 39 n=2 Tax=Anabaena variabilis TaxID=264691 RepID=Q3MEC8_TRIV2|nr:MULTISPECIES: glycosyltransferase family 39 protein [Nostocaceae]ABA20658.1 Glycosyl transferase, family 39 [Trichormus variabilis ATCC 29413]MBC1215016.1 glycosyltransferase family 39 protein [Trichormus variabilis ARAD]MBC1255080.1 glycosyltransferase family 39 protein [Trichormus variabilis V5]MBC1269285.1 glycosyltransferase family 39 protein [Trichormus variabilis FSR]MBC1300918.1 glycosyltransferase family 39 protein [Trichormus variabilis N2B]
MRLKLSVLGAVERCFNNLVKRPALAVTASILWLILIGWIGYGWNLGSVGLVDETEPLFAEASRQMLVTGDWITPFFNGQTRFDKPALVYWCQAIAYAVFGVNEWAVRLPSALAAMGAVSLAFYTVHWSITKKDELEQVTLPTRRYLTAGVAAGVMALNAQMIVWGRTGVSDMLLTGCIASALLCFFLGYAAMESGERQEAGDGGMPNPKGRRNKRSLFPNKWYLACYVLTAGAILTKGPVGIVLPGIIVLVFLLYVGQLRTVLREMRLVLGTVIILGLSVPWYALVIWRNGESYINSFFGYHNVERFTEVVNGHSAPWYFYFVIVTLFFAPYSVYLPLALFRLKFWQRSHWQNQERSQQLGLFACIWFLSVFSFFTIAVTKLPSYVLPLMPAAAILVALLWSDFFPSGEQTNKIEITYPSSLLLASGWVNVIFLTIVAVASFHTYHLLGNDDAAPNFRQNLQDSGLPAIGGWLWLAGAIFVAVLILRRYWHSIIGVNMLGFAAFLLVVTMPALFLMDQERQLPLRDLSAVVAQVQQPKEEIMMVGFKKPSVVFYSHKQINFVQTTEEGVEYIHNLANQAVKPSSLLLVTNKKNFFKMDLPPDNYENLEIQGAYQLTRINFKKMKTEKVKIS